MEWNNKGEYINGEKKGKEYKDKELIFDGYYLNDEKWTGKIKDYKKGYHWRCGFGGGFEGFLKFGSESNIEFENMKDYENNILKFEGEYINDERNGKGREYDINGKIIFEGDFINGNRRTKEYYNKYDDADYYVLEYEGEILEGERNGKGKEYSDYGRKIIFEGEYLRGLRWNGKYKEYDNFNKIISEKEYINGEIKEDNEHKPNEKLKNKNEYNDNKTEKVVKEFYEETDKIRFEGIYLDDEKWNGIMYNKDGNFKIKIKDGKWNLNESNFNIKYLGKDIYIIQDKNGKTKEYYNGYLIYEGEYLNDKRNGKGKEFENSKIIFEGEYKDGNRWKGKLKGLINLGLFHDREIEFDGEYINGERIGIGKEYNYEGKLKFEGEYKNDKRNGFGKEYDRDLIIYEGEYLNDERNGKGKEYYEGKLRFEGEYLNGKRWNGKFTLIVRLDKLIFEGELINGERKGKEYNYDGNLIYEGEYLNLQKNGKGKEYYKNGKIKFEGEYILDNRWTGNIYDYDGNIIFKMKNGEGNGKEYDFNGNLIYEGEYLNGVKHGKGKEFKYNRLIFEGEYLNGKRNGKGKEYYDLKELSQ